nr:hypothetical protein [Mycobacterium sp. UM_NZ2]
MSLDPTAAPVGHLAYPPQLVAILEKLADDRMSLIDTVADAPLLEIAGAVVDLLMAGASESLSEVDPATQSTVGRILHVALSRGIIRADGSD